MKNWKGWAIVAASALAAFCAAPVFAYGGAQRLCSPVYTQQHLVSASTTDTLEYYSTSFHTHDAVQGGSVWLYLGANVSGSLADVKLLDGASSTSTPVVATWTNLTPGGLLNFVEYTADNVFTLEADHDYTLNVYSASGTVDVGMDKETCTRQDALFQMSHDWACPVPSHGIQSYSANACTGVNGTETDNYLLDFDASNIGVTLPTPTISATATGSIFAPQMTYSGNLAPALYGDNVISAFVTIVNNGFGVNESYALSASETRALRYYTSIPVLARQFPAPHVHNVYTLTITERTVFGAATASTTVDLPQGAGGAGSGGGGGSSWGDDVTQTATATAVTQTFSFDGCLASAGVDQYFAGLFGLNGLVGIGLWPQIDVLSVLGGTPTTSAASGIITTYAKCLMATAVNAQKARPPISYYYDIQDTMTNSATATFALDIPIWDIPSHDFEKPAAEDFGDPVTMSASDAPAIRQEIPVFDSGTATPGILNRLVVQPKMAWWRRDAGYAIFLTFGSFAMAIILEAIGL